MTAGRAALPWIIRSLPTAISRVAPWLSRVSPQAGQWLARSGAPTIRNFLARSTGWGSKFKGPQLPGWAELGLGAADMFGLTPSWLSPATSAYWFYRSPKFMAGLSAAQGVANMLPGSAPDGASGASPPGGYGLEGNYSPGPIMSGEVAGDVPGAGWNSLLPSGGPGFRMPSPSSLPSTTYSMFG